MDTTSEALEFIKKIPLFSKLNRQALWKLAKLAQIQIYPQNEIIILEGDPSNGVFIILSGEVEVLKHFQQPQQKILAHLGPGEIIGEMGIIDNEPRSATIRTLSEVKCITILQWDFVAQLQAYPQIALELLPILVKRLRLAEQNKNIN